MKRIITIFACSVLSLLVLAQDFNIETDLRGHIDYLTSDFLEGRKAGSNGETAAADYIYEQLASSGLLMLTDENGQDFSIERDDGSIHSRNIVSMVEGYDPLLKDEYIVIGAHYDALGTNVLTIDGVEHNQIFPGADDNASGVAILIELAKMVAENSYLFPRSIVFVAFGASEQGMAGSWYFANRAFDEMSSVKVMIDLNMLGRGEDKNPLQIFSQISSETLADIMNQTGRLPVAASPEIATGQIASSDYLPFYDKKIPVFMFTTGMTREYHTLKDTPDLLQYHNMESFCNYLFYFLETISIQKSDLLTVDNEKSGAKSNDDTVYSIGECEVKPQFFHSDETHFLESWVYKYVKYPKSAVSGGEQGKVYVSFIIEKDGSVSNVQVIQGVTQALDDEAVKVVSISPKWIPGQIRGRKVRTKIILPIEFRLKR